MNKLKYAALMVVMIIVFAASVMIANAEEIGSGVVTASGSLNVRAWPGTEYDIIGKLYNGDVVTIYWIDGQWYQIKLSDGTLGFIHSDYVDVRKGNITSRSSATRTKAQQVCDTAVKYLGTPYVYGGSSPKGFDCSGFTSYVYKECGVTLNRTSRDQFSNGVAVSKDELKPGDLVFFSRVGSVNSINHVGLYVGNGKMIHSPETGKVVSYASINEGYYLRTYVGARRIFQ